MKLLKNNQTKFSQFSQDNPYFGGVKKKLILKNLFYLLAKRANEQTNKRTNEQTNKRTNEQTKQI